MTTLTLKTIAERSGVCFGTSGARGRADDMTDAVCAAYVTAFLQTLAPDATRIALGRDLRPSSPRIAAACAAAMKTHGAAVVFAGTLPTPALACYAMQQGIPAIMVTGSHIPFDRNGIKFYLPAGEISKAHEDAILHAEVAMPTIYPAAAPLPPEDRAPLEHYRERYLRFFPADFLHGLRIGVYQHSGVARDFLCELLQCLGATVVPLGRTDAFVPVDTEAVSEEDQAQGRAWAAEQRLDALLSTDGDADRPLIGDESGHWLRGDAVGLLCAQYLDAATVATPVSSSTAIEKCGAFSQVMRTRIGSPYVIEAMEKALAAGAKRVVGFEANGGFLVGDGFERNGRRLEALPTRDAVLPMLALLALAKERGAPLSALEAALPRRFTASGRIQDFPAESSRMLLGSLATSRAAVDALVGEICGEATGQDETDGLRLTFASGEIVHLRPSGNAPELRCYAEADSDARARELVRLTLERILGHPQGRHARQGAG